jgi:hypothetical protein
MAAAVTSVRHIAAALDQRGISTARGYGPWSPAQVHRLLNSFAAPSVDPMRSTHGDGAKVTYGALGGTRSETMAVPRRTRR